MCHIVLFIVFTYSTYLLTYLLTLVWSRKKVWEKVRRMWQYFWQNFSLTSIAYVYLLVEFLFRLFFCFFFFMFICCQLWWKKMHICVTHVLPVIWSSLTSVLIPGIGADTGEGTWSRHTRLPLASFSSENCKKPAHVHRYFWTELCGARLDSNISQCLPRKDAVLALP